MYRYTVRRLTVANAHRLAPSRQRSSLSLSASNQVARGIAFSTMASQSVLHRLKGALRLGKKSERDAFPNGALNDFRTVQDPYEGVTGSIQRSAPKVYEPPVKPAYYPTVAGETPVSLAKKNMLLDDYMQIPSYCMIHDFETKEDVAKWRIVTDAEVGGTSQAQLSWGTATCPITHRPIRTLVFQGRLGRLLMPEYEKRSNEGGMLHSLKNFATKDDSIVPASEEEVAKYKARMKAKHAEGEVSDLTRNEFGPDDASQSYVESGDDPTAGMNVDGFDVKAQELADVNGFCGIIGPVFQPALATDEWDAYNICVRTDGGPWTVTMRIPSTDDTEMFVAGIGPEGGGPPKYPREVNMGDKRMRNLFLPFSEFTGSSAGRMKETKYNHATGISSFGISIRGPPGPFRIELAWIALKNVRDADVIGSHSASSFARDGSVALGTSVVPCPDLTYNGVLKAAQDTWTVVDPSKKLEGNDPEQASSATEPSESSVTDVPLDDYAKEAEERRKAEELEQSKRRIQDLLRALGTDAAPATAESKQQASEQIENPFANEEFMRRKEQRERANKLRRIKRLFGHLADNELRAFLSDADLKSMREIPLVPTEEEARQYAVDDEWETRYRRMVDANKPPKPVLWSEVRSRGQKLNPIRKWLSGVSRFFGLPVSSADKEVELAMAQLRARELSGGEDFVIIIDPPSEQEKEMEEHMKMQEQLMLHPFDPTRPVTDIERNRFAGSGDEVRPPYSALAITVVEERDAEQTGKTIRMERPREAEVESMLDPKVLQELKDGTNTSKS